jgi:hypothetical protein
MADNYFNAFKLTGDPKQTPTKPQLVDGSDAMANKGFTVSFQHVPSGKSVSFKAFITAFNESFNSDWSEESVYGRVDPIRMFKQNSRSITLGLNVPAASEGEAFENLAKVQKLISYLYPSYTDVDNSSTISQSPLIRMRVMNLASNAGAAACESSVNKYSKSGGYTYDELAAGQGPGRISDGDGGYKNTSEDITGAGLLGFIKNLAIAHNIENPDFGVFEYAGGNILPKMIELNLDFGVIHEHAIGWGKGVGSKEFSSETFPYGANLQKSSPRSQEELRRLQIEGAALYPPRVLDQQEEEEEIIINEQAKASAEANLIKAGIGVGIHTREAQAEVKAVSEDRSTLDGIIDMLDNY